MKTFLFEDVGRTFILAFFGVVFYGAFCWVQASGNAQLAPEMMAKWQEFFLYVFGVIASAKMVEKIGVKFGDGYNAKHGNIKETP